MRAARPTIRRFLKIVGRASLTRRLPRHPLPEGEGTHDKQVSVFEDRPEPHPAWVSGELIAVFRTLVVIDRPYNLQFQNLRGAELRAYAEVFSLDLSQLDNSFLRSATAAGLVRW